MNISSDLVTSALLVGVGILWTISFTVLLKREIIKKKQKAEQERSALRQASYDEGKAAGMDIPNGKPLTTVPTEPDTYILRTMAPKWEGMYLLFDRMGTGEMLHYFVVSGSTSDWLEPNTKKFDTHRRYSPVRVPVHNLTTKDEDGKELAKAVFETSEKTLLKEIRSSMLPEGEDLTGELFYVDGVAVYSTDFAKELAAHPEVRT